MLPNILPTRLTTIEHYLQYFENIACKIVGHTDDDKRFYTRVEDINGAGLKYPLMLVVLHPVSYPGQRDALYEAFEFDFWIVRQFGTDEKLLMTRLNECKVDCDDIVTKLEFDSMPGVNKPFQYFNLPDLQGQALDDLGFPDKVVAWSNSARIGNIKNFTYNAARWL